MFVKLRPLFPYLCITAVVLSAVALRLLSPRSSPVERFLDDSSIRTTDLSNEVQEALHFLMNAAKDDTQWKVNQNPHSGVHTVILFSGNKARAVPEYAQYVKTIAWVSEFSTIVIDVDYLRDVAEQLTSLGPLRIENPYERDFREGVMLKIFLLWVVGHEAGHAHYHDSTRHFSANSFEAPEPGGVANQVIETRADDFVARLVSSSRQRLLDLSEMLFEILNVNLEARMPKTNIVGPSIQMFSNDSVEVLTSGSHPEFIVRVARILADIQYPPGTEERYGAWAAKLLDRINSAQGTSCSVMARTRPVSADVSVQQNNQPPVVYWSPASLLLSPGKYHITVSAKGFKPTTQEIDIPDCKHLPELNIQMERLTDPPKPPLTPVEEFVSRRERTIVRISRAQYLQQQGQWKAAGWELDRAAEIDPGSSETIFLQALMREHDRNLTEAKNLHDRAVGLRTHEIAGYDLGPFRLDQIQREMAEDTRALLGHPNEETAIRSMGELWLELGRYDLAQPLVERLRGQPGSCEDHVNMSRLLLALGRPRDAVLHLNQSAKCVGPVSVDGMIALATQLEEVDEEAKAEQWVVRAYKKDPENAWSDFADFLRKRGRSQEALSYAQAAARRTADDTEALNAVANIELELGRLDIAELWFKRALKTYNENSEALIGLAHIAGQLGRWDQARTFCGDAVKGNSWGNFEGWICVGDAENGLGNSQQALTAYRNASWLHPGDVDLYSKIGQTYSKLSDPNRAALYARFAKPSNPDVVHFPEW
jgi:tetratricopeptide (TPR) repeat protein